MGWPVYRFPFGNAGCALIVQKIKINFASPETIVYSSQTIGQPVLYRMTESTDRQAFQQLLFFMHKTRFFAFA